MIGFGSQAETELDVSRFDGDKEIRVVAEVVARHAEKRRREYRLTEQPVKRGPLDIEGYWSDSVPWCEWMTEPSILQSCAEECELPIFELANLIAYQIRPINWQVFSWMGMAIQGREYEEVLTDSLPKYATELMKVRKCDETLLRSNFAKSGAKAKLATDLKQKDKASVRECWDIWQKEPDRYKGKAAFARDMRDKYINLESQPVIEGWCREWGRKT